VRSSFARATWDDPDNVRTASATAGSADPSRGCASGSKARTAGLLPSASAAESARRPSTRSNVAADWAREMATTATRTANTISNCSTRYCPARDIPLRRVTVVVLWVVQHVSPARRAHFRPRRGGTGTIPQPAPEPGPAGLSTGFGQRRLVLRNVNAMNLTFSAYTRVTGITAQPSIESPSQSC
jgi:hypothetical protein